MKTNKAFSLVEILVALIIVSLIMAALAPVITKKLSSAGITIGGGGGGSGEPEIELECSDIDPNCVACADDKCVKCATNYKVTNDGKCESDGPTYTMRAPSRQEDCDPYKAHYFQGTCITKQNAGDTNGAPIEGVTGVEIKSVGTKCTTNSCCWEGRTSEEFTTFTINSTYSGGDRTLCSWDAAKAICENYDINDTKGKWHLPTADQLAVWVAKNNNNDYSSSLSLLTKYLGRDGLDLCTDGEDYNGERYGAAICKYKYKSCMTSSYTGAHCYAYQVWGDKSTSANAHYISLSTGTMSANTVAKADGGRGVRCVLDEVYAEDLTNYSPPSKDMSNYVTPTTQEECDQYNAHYFESNGVGSCITKANIGDTLYGGPPVSSSGTSDVGSITDIGIQVISPGQTCTTNTCCWTGGNTSGECTTFTPYQSRSYSGCQRTMCDWWASEIACANYNVNDSKGLWTLPTDDDIQRWVTANNINDISASTALLSKYLTDRGVGLCTNAEDYENERHGAPICKYMYEGCMTASASTAHCNPYQVWATTPGVAATAITANIVSLSGATMTASTANKYDGGRSSRCVLRLVKKKTLPTERQKVMPGRQPSSQADCNKYKAIYLSNNKTCITKGNAGDIDKGGAPLSTNGTGTINARTDLGIYIIKPGTTCTTNYCCWSAAATSGECTTYSKVGSYDGCTRTVCDWYAAKAACDNYDIEGTYGLWELPTHADFQVWKSVIDSETSSSAKLSRFLGKDGLDLCTNSEDYAAESHGASGCKYLYQGCKTASASEGHCYPYQIWGVATDTAIEAKQAYQIGMNSGTMSINTATNKYDGGRSVRCVLRYLPDS